MATFRLLAAPGRRAMHRHPAHAVMRAVRALVALLAGVTACSDDEPQAMARLEHVASMTSIDGYACCEDREASDFRRHYMRAGGCLEGSVVVACSRMGR